MKEIKDLLQFTNDYEEVVEDNEEDCEKQLSYGLLYVCKLKKDLTEEQRSKLIKLYYDLYCKYYHYNNNYNKAMLTGSFYEVVGLLFNNCIVLDIVDLAVKEIYDEIYNILTN